MANKVGRPVGGSSITPRIRGYFSAALDILVKKKEPLDKLIAKGLQEDLKGTLSALARYMPAEIELTVDDNRAEEMTDAELAVIATESSARVNKKASSKKKPSSIH